MFFVSTLLLTIPSIPARHLRYVVAFLTFYPEPLTKSCFELLTIRFRCSLETDVIVSPISTSIFVHLFSTASTRFTRFYI